MWTVDDPSGRRQVTAEVQLAPLAADAGDGFEAPGRPPRGFCRLAPEATRALHRSTPRREDAGIADSDEPQRDRFVGASLEHRERCRMIGAEAKLVQQAAMRRHRFAFDSAPAQRRRGAGGDERRPVDIADPEIVGARERKGWSWPRPSGICSPNSADERADRPIWLQP